MRIAILSLLLAAGVSGARAEAPVPAGDAPPARRRMASIAFGLIEPVSKVHFRSIGGGSADNGDLGVQFGAQYVQFLTPRLGAGLGIEYWNRSATFSTRLFPAADAGVQGESWLMLGLLRYSLTDRGWARPFVLLGAGGAWNKTIIDVRPSVWADTGTKETRRLIDDGAWTPAASLRAGLDLDIDAAKPGFLTFEAGWTALASARYRSTPRGRALGLSEVSAPLSVLSFTARYAWRF